MSKYEKDKFYWLQLKEDFFEEDSLSWLEEQENGEKYSLFYLKLCLKSLKTKGILIRTVGNLLIPYDKKKLAEITKTDVDTVVIAMELLEKIGLVQILGNGEIYCTQVANMIGEKSVGAFKKEQQRLIDQNRKIGQISEGQNENDPKVTTNDPKMTLSEEGQNENDLKMTQFDPKMTLSEEGQNENDLKMTQCSNSNKNLKTLQPQEKDKGQTNGGQMADNCPPDIEIDIDIEIDKDIDNIYGQNEFDLNHLPKNDLGQNGSKNKEGGQDIENDISNYEPPNTEVWEEQFEKFYKEYPRKVKKQNVKKWFKKNKPSSELFSSMMRSLEQFRGAKDWLADNGQYIPYPSTWLNQKRWEDEDINNAKTIPKARTKEERHIHQMKVLEGL